MAGTAVLGRLTWQVGRVVETVTETPRVKSLLLDIEGWAGHLAGQHVDVRLTAEDGYHTVRSYSIASPPEEPRIALTIERLDDGEVSPYLVDEVRSDDPLEIRGPIGGYFVWDVSQGGPLFLVAGGSGIAPLMAIIRHRRAAASTVPVTLLYSAQSPQDVIFRRELNGFASEPGIDVIFTFTRTSPADWAGYTRRIDASLLAETAPAPEEHGLAYICGPTDLVEVAAAGMVELGHEPARIKTERFGPTRR